jgi:hypothetical protein
LVDGGDGAIMGPHHDSAASVDGPQLAGRRARLGRAIGCVVSRQGRATALAGAAAVAWRLGPLPEPERLLDYVILGITVALMIEGLVVAMQRDRGDRCADDLIEGGFAPGGRSDPVSRAVQARIDHVSSAPNRRKLANALRWQLELEARPADVRAAYQPFPPLCGFSAHGGRIVRVADTLERGPCDPRVSIRLARLLSEPERLTGDHDQVAIVLGSVEELLVGGTTQLRPDWPQNEWANGGGDYPDAATSEFHETGRRFSMDTVSETIEEARRLLGEGREKRAADLLISAAGECRDERRMAMIRALAEQGRERAGRFGKRRWEEAIRLAEEQPSGAGT